MDPSVLGSVMITTDEEPFTLSPALAAPYILPNIYEPHILSHAVGLLDRSHKALGASESPISHDENPFVTGEEESGDIDVQQRLPDLPKHEAHQVTTIPSEAALKLVQQTVEDSNGSMGNSPLDLSHASPIVSPTPSREALFPPINSPGCVVTIHNLPNGISMRDILPRIRGGDIRTATLVNLKNAMCAVITFKEARSAQLYVHVGKSFNDEIWTFRGGEEDAEPSRAQISYIPIFDTNKFFDDSINIPLEPRFSMEVDLATRCLAITKCSFELIEEIWKAFRLNDQLRSPHYASQFEDIWLGDFQRGRGGWIEYATLHIWYTNTNMAVGARQRAFGRHWAVNMQYEDDPCNNSPSVLFFRSSRQDDPGFAWHSNPNYSLLNVYRSGCIGELFRTWSEISEAVKAAYAIPDQLKGQPELLPSEDMAARREAASFNGGFDPVTLVSMSSQDYDSDDEGCRGPPRLDTRKIKTHRTTTRKTALPSQNACLTALETMAARALPTCLYSPGTSTALSTIEIMLEDETADHDGILKKFEDVTCFDSLSSPSLQSEETDNPEDLTMSDLTKDLVDAEQKFTNLRKALTEPTHWYTVTLAEFLACNEQQRKAMGTVFYVPPEGHNSLQRYPWNEDLRP